MENIKHFKSLNSWWLKRSFQTITRGFARRRKRAESWKLCEKLNIAWLHERPENTKKMKKHHQYFLALFLIILGYNLAYLLILNEKFIQYYNSSVSFSQSLPIGQLKFFLDVLPWYSLICFGCYCLSRLGSDILNFNDCPKEIEKMTQVNLTSLSFIYLEIYCSRTLLEHEKT